MEATTENNMPQVGNKKFPYTAKGKKQAKKYAKKVGKKMTFENPMKGVAKGY